LSSSSGGGGVILKAVLSSEPKVGFESDILEVFGVDLKVRLETIVVESLVEQEA
jgi:hypothetical protein